MVAPATVTRLSSLRNALPLTKGMTILYGWRRPTEAPRLGYTVMFSAWGAFVYRFRRPILVVAVLFAIGAGHLAGRVSVSFADQFEERLGRRGDWRNLRAGGALGEEPKKRS